MNGIAVLIPIALLLGLGGLFAFFWSLQSGQYDDLDGASLRILIDDDTPTDDNGRAQKNGTSPKGLPRQVEEL